MSYHAEPDNERNRATAGCRHGHHFVGTGGQMRKRKKKKKEEEKKKKKKKKKQTIIDG